MHIPIYKPYLEGNLKRYVNEAIDSSWISSKGKFLDKFEEKFSTLLSKETKSTAVCNGTVALDLALAVLGVGVGDEVILPNFTYVATANAVMRSGAVPVFVDADPLDWNCDVSDILDNINNRTKAIIAVHIYGASCDMEGLQSLCSNNNIFLIEDCAEAIGSRFMGRHVGTFGDIATFSFFGNKTVTTGEGGMVCAANSAFIESARHLKSQAVCAEREYWHDQIGYNFRMTNVQAAIGLSQMEMLPEILGKKQRVFDQYKEKLSSNAITFQQSRTGCSHSRWMVAVRFESEAVLNFVRRRLRENDIETRPGFPLVTDFPMYHGHRRETPVAREISSTVLCLPSFPSLEDEQIEHVAELIMTAVEAQYGQ